MKSPDPKLTADSHELESITGLLRKMGWTWLGFQFLLGSILFLNTYPILIERLGISELNYFSSLLLPLLGWSLAGFGMFQIANGLERDYAKWEPRAKRIVIIAGFGLAPPLLSFQAWLLWKRIKTYRPRKERSELVPNETHKN